MSFDLSRLSHQEKRKPDRPFRKSSTGGDSFLSVPPPDESLTSIPSEPKPTGSAMSDTSFVSYGAFPEMVGDHLILPDAFAPSANPFDSYQEHQTGSPGQEADCEVDLRVSRELSLHSHSVRNDIDRNMIEIDLDLFYWSDGAEGATTSPQLEDQHRVPERPPLTTATDSDHEMGEFGFPPREQSNPPESLSSGLSSPPSSPYVSHESMLSHDERAVAGSEPSTDQPQVPKASSPKVAEDCARCKAMGILCVPRVGKRKPTRLPSGRPAACQNCYLTKNRCEAGE